MKGLILVKYSNKANEKIYTKLSVIVPVYNVEKYLDDCLRSIISQIDNDCEIICVEDCSTDNSLGILEKYSNKYSQIKIVKHGKNKGLSAARNTGLNNAKGKYILFVDSDDMFKTNAITELMNIVEEQELDQVFLIWKSSWRMIALGR